MISFIKRALGVLTNFLVLGIVLFPGTAQAGAVITSATLNGNSSVQVEPGANIIASVTATLTDGTKWKGTKWGIGTGSLTTTCTNTKNAKEGTRNNATGVFTETFTIKAPAVPGLYNANFMADEANNCGKPISALFQKLQSIRVGINTVPPVITAHSDMTVQLTAPAAGQNVEYVKPVATDYYYNLVPVSCSPASGSFFPVGNTTVTCTATDSWGNTAIPSTFTVRILPPPTLDTIPPTIEPRADMYATTTGTSTEVSYTPPAATDNIDGAVPVTCEPASGSSFALGTTTVACSAQDAAGNAAASSFSVIVTQEVPPPPPAEPKPYVMASQPDESYLCGAETWTWRYCDDPKTFSFTDAIDDGIKTIDLGQGSNMGTGTLTSVTLAKDPSYGYANFWYPWKVTITCYVDAAHTNVCGDWDTVTDTIRANPSSDGVHWVADFSALGRTFNQGHHYTLTIDDLGRDNPAYGSESLQEPYWIITGLR